MEEIISKWFYFSHHKKMTSPRVVLVVGLCVGLLLTAIYCYENGFLDYQAKSFGELWTEENKNLIGTIATVAAVIVAILRGATTEEILDILDDD